MKDSFYVSFEESFRGTRELILDRLAIYDDFLIPMQRVHRGGAVVDLGCGRCEWIEKMLAMGFSAHGVDLDPDMLQSGIDRGFDVHHGDALTYLSNLPDDSQAIISAFHLVEHISFEQLRTLIDQAMRVLKPAGLLIMETPNAENLIVATRNFYLDPTHQKPIPLELLTFLPRLAGQDRVKLVRLQESPDLLHKATPTLVDVIGGASPDYAVIVQKKGPVAEIEQFELAFARDYGLSLQTLLERYDQTIHGQFKAINARVQFLEEQLGKALALADEAMKKSLRATSMAQQKRYGLFSRVPMLMDWLGLQRQRLAEQGLSVRTRSFVKKIAKFFLGAINRWLGRHPRLRQKALCVLHRLGLHAAIKRLVARSESMPMPAMTPRARQIQKDLRDAMSQRGEA